MNENVFSKCPPRVLLYRVTENNGRVIGGKCSCSTVRLSGVLILKASLSNQLRKEIEIVPTFPVDLLTDNSLATYVAHTRILIV
jgi:hypothetical protein